MYSMKKSTIKGTLKEAKVVHEQEKRRKQVYKEWIEKKENQVEG